MAGRGGLVIGRRLTLVDSLVAEIVDSKDNGRTGREGGRLKLGWGAHHGIQGT